MELTNEFTVPVPVERAWEVLTDVELIAPCLPGAQLQEIEGDEYRGVVKVKVGPITAEYKGAATFREQDVQNRRVVLDASGRDTRGQGSASAGITATMTELSNADVVSTHVVVESDVTIKGKVAQFGRGMIAEVSSKLLTQFVECIEGKLDGSETTATSESTAAATTAAAAGDEAEVTAAPADSAVPTDDGDAADDTSTEDVSTDDASTEDTSTEDLESAVEAAATAVQGGGNLPQETLGNPAAEAAKDGSEAETTDAGDRSEEPSAVRKITQAASDPVDLLDAAGAPVAKRLVPAAVGFLVLLFIGRWRSHRRHS